MLLRLLAGFPPLLEVMLDDVYFRLEFSLLFHIQT